MELTLSCECELGAEATRRRLGRLFGLNSNDRRGSGFVTVSWHLDTIDLPSVFFGGCCAAAAKTVFFDTRFLLDCNIQGHEEHKGWTDCNHTFL